MQVELILMTFLIIFQDLLFFFYIFYEICEKLCDKKIVFLLEFEDFSIFL